MQSDGKVVAVGQSGVQSGATLLVARFTSSGALDGSFGSGGVVTSPAIPGALDTGSVGRSVAIQPDGKIVVVGRVISSDASATDRILIERYNSNGSIDATFGTNGAVTALATRLGDGYAVALQPDGKIIAAGSADAAGSGGVTPRVAVVRLNSNGSLDSGFGAGGIDVVDLGAYSYALAAAVQADGKIVISGSQAPGLQVPNALIARLTASGALDPTFASGGAYAHQYAVGAASSAFNALAIQGTGGIIAAGAATNGNTGADAIVARFTSGGAPDGSFGSGGVVYETSAMNTGSANVPGATGVALAPNGDVIAGGTAGGPGLAGVAVWAFNPTGALDTSFGAAGSTLTGFGPITRGEGNALTIAGDGKIVVAGDTQSITGTYSSVVARYNGFAPPPPPPPPPPPALKLSLTGLSGSYKTSSVAKHGLKFSVSCSQGCTYRASLTLSSGAARRLHILTTFTKCTRVKRKRRCVKVRGYRPVTIASGKGSLRAAGTTSITLKLVRAYVKTLEQQRSVAVTLQVAASSSVTHKRQTVKKGLTFKR